MKINNGDYIDAREFTREECEKFCKLAVEQGFGRGESITYKNIKNEYPELCIYNRQIHWSSVKGKNNITTQFRAYLDSKKQFPKADLKDGMVVEFKDGSELVYFRRDFYKRDDVLKFICNDNILNNELDNVSLVPYLKSMGGATKVTDRDGTLVFEREAERKKVTIELTDEQIESLKSQVIL